MIPANVILEMEECVLYILLTKLVGEGSCSGDENDRKCENFMLVSGVSFFGCENFFAYEEKGHERMRKKAVYIGIAVAMILAVGGMAAYGYYDIVYPLALALFSMI